VQPTEFSFEPGSELARFIAKLAQASGADLPPLGILAGNAATAGQRFIILIFDTKQRPAFVIKAGLSARAQELVGQEERFLARVPSASPGIPPLRAVLQTSRLRALALDFVRGRSPRSGDTPALAPLLSAWVHTGQQLRVPESRAWIEMKAACSDHPVFKAIAPALEARTVAAAITHGDFAPWNIKVERNRKWTVLDWERGDLRGIPAWDWLHFVIQPAILVHRQGPPALVDLLERLFASSGFSAYAQPAGIMGMEHEIALAYLLHHNEVIRPSEGLETGRGLLAALAKRWIRQDILHQA
jgi:hypothetical protein